jgi:hypothetical protein
VLFLIGRNITEQYEENRGEQLCKEILKIWTPPQIQDDLIPINFFPYFILIPLWTFYVFIVERNPYGTEKYTEPAHFRQKISSGIDDLHENKFRY